MSSCPRIAARARGVTSNHSAGEGVASAATRRDSPSSSGRFPSLGGASPSVHLGAKLTILVLSTSDDDAAASTISRTDDRSPLATALDISGRCAIVSTTSTTTGYDDDVVVFVISLIRRAVVGYLLPSFVVFLVPAINFTENKVFFCPKKKKQTSLQNFAQHPRPGRPAA